MRWEHLERGHEQQPSLPGLNDPVVRTFDAPEALGIRFHEVHARSAINAVPKRSRMPFRFTINPYRGCTHACSYCLDGETRVLMASGNSKRLCDLKVGDAIYGTVRRGTYRRYAITTVLAHWRTNKTPYRITLTDGTELVASADHRFLTRRGWKHVMGTEQGRTRRPHLTLNNKLMGLGTSAAISTPSKDSEYRQGYLTGMVRGDGHVGSYEYERAGRTHGNVHRFRLALADVEALHRTREYLTAIGIATKQFAFSEATPRWRAITAIRTSAMDRVAAIRTLITWPRSPSTGWCKGFLAGIFDAEGGLGQVIRISNKDSEIIHWTTYCLRRLRFTFVVERTLAGLTNVRLTGGLTTVMRFIQITDPAISRKRSIEGRAIKGDVPLDVVSIEPLAHPRQLFDITTGTGDFIANGVVSHNCFARPTHTYLDLNAREDFEREIVVKVNTPERVRAELGKSSWKGDHVALGTNTDPYQWVEGRYRLTRGVWEAMRDFSNPCSVLTKSPLLLRDIDLFRELVARTEFSANLSIPTLEEKVWRQTEPHTPHPRKRIEAVAELRRNGIPSNVLVAPLMPGVNDSPEQVERLLELVGEAGAENVTPIGLHLRGEVRDIFFDWLRQYRPDLIPRYERLYDGRAYLPAPERKRLAALAAGRRRTSNARGIA